MVVAAWSLVTCGDSGTEPPPPAPPANRAPEVRGPIPDQMLASGGSAATVDVSDNFADPDGDALSYAVSSLDGRVVSASVSGAMVTMRPEGVGTTTVRVTASDPGGLTATSSFAVTVVPVPDLVVGVSPDSTAVWPGGSFEYAATVRNAGDAESAATWVRTYSSSDSVVTTSDEPVGEASEVPALGPGESASRTVSYTMSSSVAVGTVIWVGECVDAVDGESDTGNNCSATIKVTVTGWPDLVVEDLWPDSVAVPPGGSFEYAVTIRNQGEGTAAATKAGTFVSADSVVTTSDEVVGEASNVPALGPGQSASRVATFRASLSASPGTVVWVGECVDAVDGELDTGNNCSAGIKVTVTGSPDLVVGVSPDSATVRAGDSFEYAATVRNAGDAESVATSVRTYSSSDSVVTTSDEPVGEASEVPVLGPGESATRTVSYTVGASAAPGAVVWVGECVDAVDGESDTDNNCSAAIKVTVPLPASAVSFSQPILGPAEAGKRYQGDALLAAVTDSTGMPVAGARYRWVAADSSAGWMYPPTGITDSLGTVVTTSWVGGWPGQGTMTLVVENDGSADLTVDLNTTSTSSRNPPNGQLYVWVSTDQGAQAQGFSVDMTPLEEPCGTYYAAIQWDGGYTGLQRCGSQHDRQLQFSVWNVPNVGSAEVVRRGEGVVCRTFGGEGTGQACELNYPWSVGSTYRFEVTEAEMNGGSAMTLHVTDLAAGDRRFVGTLRFARRANLRQFGMFTEDFILRARHCLARLPRSASIRRAMAWVDGSWQTLTRGRIGRWPQDPKNPGTPSCANAALRNHSSGLEVVVGGDPVDPDGPTIFQIPR